MKTTSTLILITIILILSACNTPAPQTISLPHSVVNLNDSLLRELTQADDYGMRQYVMAFLKAGPNRNQDSAEATQLQRAHLDNIVRMAEAGQLVLAGPFMDDGEVRGIYIFDVTTIEEAKALTATDPAIKAGRLEMELHPWYGSAALMAVNTIHEKVSSKNP